MSERTGRVSKRVPAAKAGDESGARPRPGGTAKLPAAAKTGRAKRPAKPGKTTQRARALKKDEQELETISPFQRGVSIAVKFAAFTAAVVGLFMGVQGWLTLSITGEEMDEQIMAQGMSVVATLEGAVDRGFWVQHPDPEQHTTVPREQLVADWERRLGDLVERSDGQILVASILEKGRGGRQEAVAQYPSTQLRIEQNATPIREEPTRKIVVFEGKLGDRRVRRFDMPIRLGLDRDKRVEELLAKLGQLDGEGAGEEQQLPVLTELRELTGVRRLKSYEEARRWREEHPALVRLGDETLEPWVSVFVQASRLDELKSALSKRITLVTLSGAAAGILLTVLIATVLTGPVRQLEQEMTVVAGGDLSIQSRVGTRDEIGALAHVLNVMIRNLRTAQNNAVERKSFERELSICREIQEKLLPERIPQIPGFDIQSHYNAAREVGGDYYDFIVIDQTHLGIIVADVAGKGVPGAMVMTMARSLVRLASVRNVSPADTFKKVNRILAKDIRRGMFVTAAYMVLNVKTRKLRVASAGHNPCVLFRAATGEVELVKPAGIALGFDKGPIFDANIKEIEVQLEQGDRIVSYTDGANEAMNDAEEEFGDDRFFDLVREHSRKSSKDCVAAIVAALDAHRGKAEQSDDITITTLAVTDASPQGGAQVQDDGEGGDGTG